MDALQAGQKDGFVQVECSRCKTVNRWNRPAEPLGRLVADYRCAVCDLAYTVVWPARDDYWSVNNQKWSSKRGTLQAEADGGRGGKTESVRVDGRGGPEDGKAPEGPLPC